MFRGVAVGPGSPPFRSVLTRRVRPLLVLMVVIPTSLTLVVATAIPPAGAISSTITLGTLSPSATAAGQSYVGSISISGGTAPYNLAINSSDLPSGGLDVALSGSTIHITGTPGGTGTFSVNLTISDNDGDAAATQGYSVTVESTPIVISTMAAPTGDTGGYTYTYQLSIQGGTTPYTLSDATGLPPGLNASLENVDSIIISGQATSLGTYSNVSLTVTDSLGEKGTVAGSITIVPPPSLSASLSPSSWTVNQPNYSGTTSINVGSSPFFFTPSGLPPGLAAALNGSDDDVLITGTPTSTGTYSHVSFTITDAWGATATQTYTITINALSPVDSLSPTGSILPKGAACGLYSQAFSAGAGYSYAIGSGYPPRLSFNTTNGTLSGQLSTAGDYSFRITASGPGLPTITKTYTLQVGLCVGGGTTVLPSGRPGHPYSFSLSGSGGTAPYRFVLQSGGLPPNLSLSQSGLISGMPSSAGTSTFEVYVADSANPVNTGLQTMTITIS